MYLGDSGRIFTTGFSRYNDREYCVWSQHDLSKPLERDSIDSSSGVLFPFYDHDTRIIFLAGKGDGNVRYFELPQYVLTILYNGYKKFCYVSFCV